MIDRAFIERYAAACVAESWKGADEVASHAETERELAECEAILDRAFPKVDPIHSIYEIHKELAEIGNALNACRSTVLLVRNLKHATACARVMATLGYNVSANRDQLSFRDLPNDNSRKQP